MKRPVPFLDVSVIFVFILMFTNMCCLSQTGNETEKEISKDSNKTWPSHATLTIGSHDGPNFIYKASNRVKKNVLRNKRNVRLSHYMEPRLPNFHRNEWNDNSYGWGWGTGLDDESQELSQIMEMDLGSKIGVIGLLGLKGIKTLKFLSALGLGLKCTVVAFIAFKLGLLLSPILLPFLAPAYLGALLLPLVPMLVFILLARLLSTAITDILNPTTTTTTTTPTTTTTGTTTGLTTTTTTTTTLRPGQAQGRLIHQNSNIAWEIVILTQKVFDSIICIQTMSCDTRFSEY